MKGEGQKVKGKRQKAKGEMLKAEGKGRTAPGNKGGEDDCSSKSDDSFRFVN